MPVLQRLDGENHYEERGQGYPITPTATRKAT